MVELDNNFPEYVPSAKAELVDYENLWHEANPAQQHELDSVDAIKFLRQYGVHLAYLRKIWKLIGASSSVNREQFFSLLRYIVLIQAKEIEYISKGQEISFPLQFI